MSKSPTEVPTMHIKIASQQNEDIVFKVKITTTFDKIMDKYCDRYNIKHKDQVRFLNDGVKISKDKTPQDLQLEDGDTIECTIEQEGGSFNLANLEGLTSMSNQIGSRFWFLNN